MVPAAVIIVAVANMAATTSAVGVRYLAHHMARWAAGDLEGPASQPQRRPIRLTYLAFPVSGKLLAVPVFGTEGANFAMKSRPLWRARSG